MSHEPAETVELRRALGAGTAVSIIVGAIIGAGVFVKPQWVASSVGATPWALLAWLTGGILAFLGAVSMAEVASLRPRAGGVFVYLQEAYGPIFGFLAGWAEFWIIRTGSIAALATAGAQTLVDMGIVDMNGDTTRRAAALCIVILGTINCLGIQWGGLFQNLTTSFKIAALAGLILLPVVLLKGQLNHLGWEGAHSLGRPVTMSDFGNAVLGVLWAYSGWISIGALGEELKDPQRNVPRVLAAGVGLVALIYVAINIAYSLVLPQSLIANHEEVSIVGVTYMKAILTDYGPSWMWLGAAFIAWTLVISAIGSANVDMMTGPRCYLAMARAGHLPSVLHWISPRFQTPIPAIALQTTWAAALVLGAEYLRESPNESPFDTLTNYVVFAIIMFESLVVASVIRYRFLLPHSPRSYRTWGYPWTTGIYLSVMCMLFINTIASQPTKSSIGLLFLAVGAVFYYVFAQDKKAPL